MTSRLKFQMSKVTNDGRSLLATLFVELRNALVITDFGYTRKEHELLPKISTVQDLACEKSHVRGSVDYIIDYYYNYTI